MSNGLSLRALLDYINNEDINGLKGFLLNKHVQVSAEIQTQTQTNLLTGFELSNPRPL